MASSDGRPIDLGDPCTPMAWQQRDLNYHQSGYQDRYGPGAVGGGSSRMGPPSTSDRLSHHTDKSWRVHRDSRDSGQPHLVPYGGHGMQMNQHYASGPPPSNYPPSRPSYSSGRPPSNPHSPSSTSSSSSSSSTSEEDSSQQPGDVMPHGQMPPMPHPIYGYAGFHPGYPHPPPTGPMGATPGYPGTMKSARSVPALALATWDGEPCPIHGGGPMPFPGPPPPGYPPMMPPGPLSLPPPPASTRRASSIYDMRIMSPHHHPGGIYGTLPATRNIPGDRRSLAGSTILGPAAPGAPPGIPTHLLPPMARPRPLVVGEKGTPEPLPVRNGDKNGSLPPALSMKAASVGHPDDEKKKNKICCRGGTCVAWVILAVVCLGILLGVMLRFIL